MTKLFLVGDVVEYNSRSGNVIRGTVERVRDTVEEPLANSKAPPSRYLLTLSYVDPVLGTKYVNIYNNRVVRLISGAWVTL